ncbi:MAG: energy transducer TonB [Deltaproteobacteria bacterium]|nr:energy transducer TonB [Deltaproteobacteria bacterium]
MNTHREEPEGRRVPLIVVSSVMHLVVIVGLIALNRRTTMPHGTSAGVIMLELTSAAAPARPGPASTSVTQAVPQRSAALHPIRPDTPPRATARVTSSHAASTPSADNDGPAEGYGQRDGSRILAQIGAQIRRALVYPSEARRQQIEGGPIVEFALKEDGTLGSHRIVTSSGSPLLDTAALSTLEHATPFPYYPETITIPIVYQLR